MRLYKTIVRQLLEELTRDQLMNRIEDMGQQMRDMEDHLDRLEESLVEKERELQARSKDYFAPKLAEDE